ncbi:hypothetical protein DESC_940105 [Desulfosarcina cetonica]|nr:hypothetical protein DESC_940105 [Desulfosarcina cetonica]
MIDPPVTDMRGDLAGDGQGIGQKVQVTGDANLLAFLIENHLMVRYRENRPAEGLGGTPFGVDFVNDLLLSPITLTNQGPDHGDGDEQNQNQHADGEKFECHRPADPEGGAAQGFIQVHGVSFHEGLSWAKPIAGA